MKGLSRYQGIVKMSRDCQNVKGLSRNHGFVNISRVCQNTKGFVKISRVCQEIMGKKSSISHLTYILFHLMCRMYFDNRPCPLVTNCRKCSTLLCAINRTTTTTTNSCEEHI